jgi:FlaG/FlaF family flagellin (archaellin)
MVAIAVILVMVTTVATAGMLGMIDEPAAQSTIETSQTETGIEANVLASDSKTPILVTRNGNEVGTMNSDAGTTTPFLATK